MNAIKSVANSVRYVLERLWKLFQVESPSLITDAVDKAIQLFALVQTIFLGILLVQLVFLLLDKQWKRAAIFGGTTVAVAVFRYWAYPALVAMLPAYIH